MYMQELSSKCAEEYKSLDKIQRDILKKS